MSAQAEARASGIGSWPGTSAVDAAQVAFGELPEPHIPYLPELPARGPGADLVGRAAALLVDMPVDLQPSGWRLVSHPGRDLERARSWLRQDLDVLAETADGYTGPLKIQVAGPWTLAAALRLPRLERAVNDAGACRDLVASLTDGVARHVSEVSGLVPGARVIVQIDEPSLPDVLAGRLPTASGFGRLRAIEETVALDGLRSVLAAHAQTLVHCCADDAPIEALTRSGAGALAVDVSRLGSTGWEAVAAAVEAGVGLWAGAIPTTGAVPRPEAVADAVWVPWRRLGLDAAAAAGVVLTPACGLAGASASGARAAIRAARDAAAILTERALG